MGPTEDRITCAPWGQSIDLSAHYAVEKFRGAFRQLERSRQEMVCAQDELGAAAAQQRGQAWRQAVVETAVQPYLVDGRAGVASQGAERESTAILLLDQLDASGRAKT